MKTTHILIGLMAAGSMMMAGSVTIPNTFVAGETAKASEVNGNFAAVKTAVNGNVNDIASNKSKITANEAAVSDKVSSVTASNAAGVTATKTGTDVTLKLAEGFVSISPTAFVSGNTKECYGSSPLAYLFGLSGPYYHFLASSPSPSHLCYAFAQVSLPDGAKMGSLSCKLRKNDGKTDKGKLLVTLRHASTVIATAELAQDFNNADWQTASGTVTGPSQNVDNESGSYNLVFVPPVVSGTADGAKDLLGECVIDYFYE